MTKFDTTMELEAAQNKAYELSNEGMSMAEIQATLGLNYSQAWLGISALRLKNGDVECDYLDITDAKAIVKARNVEGPFSSWGWLAVRAQCSESKVRSVFRSASAVSDRGLRIGKGGRFADDVRDLYVGEAQKHGVQIPIGQKTIVKAQAAEASSANTVKELKAMASRLGIDPMPKKKTDILAAIKAAQ